MERGEVRGRVNRVQVINTGRSRVVELLSLFLLVVIYSNDSSIMDSDYKYIYMKNLRKTFLAEQQAESLSDRIFWLLT